ncbi:MAG TPA: type II toxin-antitoxin system prevent-host-death family antitoxin [Tepidiformaceae bacterium]|nr:type II toxin-antitoxin system prevent-host-death family antitoxin [Tepidiformaceae bacterium]
MSRSYSIAEATEHLPQVVEEASRGEGIQLTRDGEPVAVVLSIEEYRQLRPMVGHRISFREAYRRFREEFPAGTEGIGPEYFDSLRERDPGRDVEL